MNYDTIVIGGGAAGMSAAKTLLLSGKKVLLIEHDEALGGVLNQCIHNGFGIEYYKEDLTGPSFSQKLANEIKSLNCDILLNTHVIKVTRNKKVSFINDKGLQTIQTSSVIFAVGSYERSAGAINLPGKRLKGIYSAGSAQKFINLHGNLVGRRIFVLGSGDIGLIMARRMTLEGATVVGVAEIMPHSSGLARNIKQCLDDFNIPLYLSHTVVDCQGKDSLDKVVVQEVDSKFNVINGTQKEFKVDSLLLAVGLIPITNFYESLNLVKNFKTKSVKVDSTYQTSEEGFYAVGNCLHIHDIVDYAAKDGEIAATYCNKYLDKKIQNKKLVSISTGNGILYTVPSFIDCKNIIKQIVISFRVKKIYTNVKIIVKQGNTIIYDRKKDVLLPAEMEQIRLKDSLIENKQSIELYIEESNEDNMHNLS